MIIKVCGIKDAQNLLDIGKLRIEMVGYNFYALSPRFVDQSLPQISEKIKKVGVFVNATIDEIKKIIQIYNLDYAQLHGDESLEYIECVKSFIPTIKVFRINDDFKPKILKYYDFCDYFLFDTASKNYGGSGQKFNWKILNNWEINRPFLLSGGIGPDDFGLFTTPVIDHSNYVGIDINSKFEVYPGFKDIKLLKDFVDRIKPI